MNKCAICGTDAVATHRFTMDCVAALAEENSSLKRDNGRLLTENIRLGSRLAGHEAHLDAGLTPSAPHGIELVDRFNEMAAKLRMFADPSNWIVQEAHRGDAYKGSILHVSTLWAPDVRFRDRMGAPWLIAQEALGMKKEEGSV